MDTISCLLLKSILSHGSLSCLGDGSFVGDVWNDFSENLPPPDDDLLLSHALGILNTYWNCAYDSKAAEEKRVNAAIKFFTLYMVISKPNRLISDKFHQYQISIDDSLTQVLVDAQLCGQGEGHEPMVEHESVGHQDTGADGELPVVSGLAQSYQALAADVVRSTIGDGTSSHADPVAATFTAQDSRPLTKAVRISFSPRTDSSLGDDGDNEAELDRALDKELLPATPPTWTQKHYLQPALADQELEEGDEVFGVVAPVTCFPPNSDTYPTLSPPRVLRPRLSQAQPPTPTPVPGVNWPRHNRRNMTTARTRQKHLNAGNCKPSSAENPKRWLSKPPRKTKSKERSTACPKPAPFPAARRATSIRRAKTAENVSSRELIVIQHAMSGVPVNPPAHQRQPATQTKIIQSFLDEDPSIPVRCGYGTNQPFDVYYVRIHPHATFKESEREEVENLRMVYWDHIPFDLNDGDLLEPFPWLETDPEKIYRTGSSVSDILDIARKFHKEAQNADNFAGYRKILAILIYRILRCHTKSPVELNEIESEFPEYTKETMSVALCLVGLCVRLNGYIGRHMALINHFVVNVGMTELKNWFKPTRRPFVFHKLLDHLRNRRMSPLKPNSSPSGFDLNHMTVIEHVRRATTEIQEISSDQVMTDLAWISDVENERIRSIAKVWSDVMPSAVLNKAARERGTKRKADRSPAVQTRRKRVDDDSGFCDGPSGSSESTAPEDGLLRVEVEQFAASLERGRVRLTGKPSVGGLRKPVCDANAVRGLSPGGMLDNSFVDFIVQMIKARDVICLGTQVFLELLKPNRGKCCQWVSSLPQTGKHWVVPVRIGDHLLAACIYWDIRKVSCYDPMHNAAAGERVSEVLELLGEWIKEISKTERSQVWCTQPQTRPKPFAEDLSDAHVLSCGMLMSLCCGQLATVFESTDSANEWRRKILQRLKECWND